MKLIIVYFPQECCFRFAPLCWLRYFEVVSTMTCKSFYSVVQYKRIKRNRFLFPCCHMNNKGIHWNKTNDFQNILSRSINNYVIFTKKSQFIWTIFAGRLNRKKERKSRSKFNCWGKKVHENRQMA